MELDDRHSSSRGEPIIADRQSHREVRSDPIWSERLLAHPHIDRSSSLSLENGAQGPLLDWLRSVPTSSPLHQPYYSSPALFLVPYCPNWKLTVNTGLAVRVWQLGLEMRPFFNKESLWVYPIFAGTGASFGYWLQGVDERQQKVLGARRTALLEKRARRAEREAAEADA